MAGSVQKSRDDNVVRMWVQLNRRCVSCVLQREHSGNECILASILCKYTLYKYTLRKGDLFVLSWARVRRVRRKSISSEMLMCGGGVRSIVLLPQMAHVCFYVCYSDCVGLWECLLCNGRC